MVEKHINSVNICHPKRKGSSKKHHFPGAMLVSIDFFPNERVKSPCSSGFSSRCPEEMFPGPQEPAPEVPGTGSHVGKVFPGKQWPCEFQHFDYELYLIWLYKYIYSIYLICIYVYIGMYNILQGKSYCKTKTRNWSHYKPFMVALAEDGMGWDGCDS